MGEAEFQQSGGLHRRSQAVKPSEEHGVAMKRDVVAQRRSNFFGNWIAFAIVSLLPACGVLYALPSAFLHFRWTHWYSTGPVYALASWISIQFLYNFAMCQLVHAGDSFDVKPAQEATGQFELIVSGRMCGTGGDRRLFYKPNFCDACQRWKPPRSHHCRACGRCMLRMDHHCSFIGNCIGMRNQGHFVLMYAFAFAGLALSVIVCIAMLATTYETWEWHEYLVVEADRIRSVKGVIRFFAIKWVGTVYVKCGGAVALQILLTVIGGTFAFFNGVPAVCLALNGVTQIEACYPPKEEVQLKPQVYWQLERYFYQKYWFLNIHELLGNRWLLRLLLPTRGGQVDLAPAIAPRPSYDGVQKLLRSLAELDQNGVVLPP